MCQPGTTTSRFLLFFGHGLMKRRQGIARGLTANLIGLAISTAYQAWGVATLGGSAGCTRTVRATRRHQVKPLLLGPAHHCHGSAAAREALQKVRATGTRWLTPADPGIRAEFATVRRRCRQGVIAIEALPVAGQPPKPGPPTSPNSKIVIPKRSPLPLVECQAIARLCPATASCCSLGNNPR